MNLFDLLDREASRLATDFRRCASECEPEARRLLGHALVRRVAAYALAIERVLYRPLRAAEVGIGPSLLDLHALLKRKVADALLASLGAQARAYAELCNIHVVLRRYTVKLRRELYPALYSSLECGERALIAGELRQWLESNRRGPHQPSRPSPRPASPRTTPSRRPPP